VLLSGRTHLGAAGVSLVTPLVLANGERVLVERGWLASADSRTAHPEYDDTSLAEVMGVVQGYPTPGMATPWVALPADSNGVALWSARALVADSARVRLGAPLADWVLRVLPVSEADEHAHEVSSRAAPSEHSLRSVDATHAPAPPEPEPYVIADESMHLSYAIQWFAFAAVIAFGALALARRKG
jgi:cytochrome oxidase assembly protein ShyY1